MYGLTKDLDLTFLVGREVEQISIGINQVVFCLDQDVRISITGEFNYFEGTKEFNWKPAPEQDGAQVAAQTVAPLGAAIKTFDSHEDGTLRLFFSNGHRLTILDSSKEYESYDITRPGSTIIV